MRIMLLLMMKKNPKLIDASFNKNIIENYNNKITMFYSNDKITAKLEFQGENLLKKIHCKLVINEKEDNICEYIKYDE